MKIPKSYKLCTIPEIIQIFKEVKEEGERLGYKPKFPLVRNIYFYNTRAHSAGTCFTCIEPNREWQYISIHSALSNNLNAIRNVLIHEYAHSVFPHDGHGYNWLITANDIAKKWGMKIEKYATEKESRIILNYMKDKMKQEIQKREKDYKYKIGCPTCGKEWKYLRMCDSVKHPEKYLCTTCKEKLINVC